ncbi:hypothetical protein [Paenibacillus oleatilyticus]|uniref:hypothetical protein n=1 Tax=Paenibacillus oleatilyticus TaxID=2594886 RepID=UPI001C1FB5B0|nr:hypothetical protein [Paenibacillus oleatilyticus]MBU7316125.1 hypothetical protein [Paenibacillus oleatilyticus]
MKKLILIVLLFFVFAGQAFANEKETKVTETIDYVYYDIVSNTYMANMLTDESGGFWVIEIDNEEGEPLETLNKRYKGKTIEIVFVGDLDTDDDIEIVSSQIIE